MRKWWFGIVDGYILSNKIRFMALVDVPYCFCPYIGKECFVIAEG